MTYILHNNTHMGMLHTHYWSYGGVVRAPDTRAERMCSVQKRPADAREAPHAKSDPAVARARPRRPPQTRRASAGGAHSPNGPRKCAALNAATALRRLKVKTRPRGRRGCGSLSAPPASRDLQAEVRSFGRASKVQVAWKVSLAAGRQGGMARGR